MSGPGPVASWCNGENRSANYTAHVQYTVVNVLRTMEKNSSVASLTILLATLQGYCVFLLTYQCAIYWHEFAKTWVTFLHHPVEYDSFGLKIFLYARCYRLNTISSVNRRLLYDFIYFFRACFRITHVRWWFWLQVTRQLAMSCPSHLTSSSRLRCPILTWVSFRVYPLILPAALSVQCKGWTETAALRSDEWFLTSSSAIAEWTRCRVGQLWPKVEDDILQTI